MDLENIHQDVDQEFDESKWQTCAYCNEQFYSNSSERMYCPEKYGKKNYCKQEQKKLVSEKKLAETVAQLSNSGIALKEGESSFERSIRGLVSIMGTGDLKFVTGDLLDRYHVNLNDLQHRTLDSENRPVIIIGNYKITWLEYLDTIFKFKITYHESN